MKKIVAKAAVFLLGIVMIFTAFAHVFTVTEYRTAECIKSFKNEAPGSLDAVYIGSSNTYAFWEAPVAWNKYGIAIHNYTAPGMPPSALKYMIEECRKTQPDAVYLINVNLFKSYGFQTKHLHYLADFMPWSMNKVNMIMNLQPLTKDEDSLLEYFFPIVRFHGNWDNLSSKAFIRTAEDMKGAVHYSGFMRLTSDVSEGRLIHHKKRKIQDNEREILYALLDYIEKENVKVQFISVPQNISGGIKLRRMNTAIKHIEEAGYDVLDLYDHPELMGIDFTKDFYNRAHTNVWGSMKFIDYLSKYLIDRYDFEDKRGQAAYASWDAAAEKYYETLGVSIPDFIYNLEERDYELAAPSLEFAVNGSNVTISWTKSEGAEGYCLYIKESGGVWTYLDQVGEDARSYMQSNVENPAEIRYLVVPFTVKDDGRMAYGDFEYKGIGAAPEAQQEQEELQDDSSDLSDQDDSDEQEGDN